MSSFIAELQKGIHARLSGAITYDSSVVPVYGVWVEEPASFPYIVLFNVAASENGTKTDNGVVVTIDIHVFERGRSSEPVYTIGNDIYDLLHRQEANITVTGYNLTQIQQESTRVFVDESTEGGRRYHHGVFTYECFVSN